MTKHDPVSFEVLTELFKPLIRQIAEEVMAETPKKEPEKRDLTVKEFCEKHHMGLSKYNDFQKNGRGPRVWYCGSQARITPEADDEWLAKGYEYAESEEGQLERARRSEASKKAAAASGQSPLHVSRRPAKGRRKGKRS